MSPQTQSTNSVPFGVILDEVKEAIPRVVETMLRTRRHTLYIDPVTCGTVHTFGDRFGDRLGQALTNLTEPSQRERLELMQTVAQGVQHAHQHGS